VLELARSFFVSLLLHVSRQLVSWLIDWLVGCGGVWQEWVDRMWLECQRAPLVGGSMLVTYLEKALGDLGTCPRPVEECADRRRRRVLTNVSRWQCDGALVCCFTTSVLEDRRTASRTVPHQRSPRRAHPRWPLRLRCCTPLSPSLSLPLFLAVVVQCVLTLSSVSW
jgi:hypothetical protein